MEMHEVASVLLRGQLDHMEPLDALELVAEVRQWTVTAAEEQMARARVLGLPWRAIAAASGVAGSTVRRWACWGAPDSPRRRVAVAS